jgi:hypothetical protein
MRLSGLLDKGASPHPGGAPYLTPLRLGDQQ